MSTPPVKIHPWRMCSIGKHWVSPYKRKIKTSQGRIKIVKVSGFCRTNRSRKDQLYRPEIELIFDKYFHDYKDLGVAAALGYKNGDKYDQIISGWVSYWNDVLAPSNRLDPALIKALVATESSFDINAKIKLSRDNWARGLMQITDQTISILKDEHGELKDYLVNLNENTAYIANLNICAGIRWLFHKQKLASGKSKRNATWLEAVIEYKSFSKLYNQGDKKALEQIKKLEDIYKALSQ